MPRTTQRTIQAEEVAKTQIEKAKEDDRQHGADSGCRPGETRITSIYRKEYANVLRNFARTSGLTFREVTLSMEKFYIESVVKPWVESHGKLVKRYELGDDYPLDIEYDGLYRETTDDTITKDIPFI